jgi:hypothetical protein
MKYSLFWDFAQRSLVFCDRRFGKTHQSPPSSVESKNNSRRAKISITQWLKPEITPSVTGIFIVCLHKDLKECFEH